MELAFYWERRQAVSKFMWKKIHAVSEDLSLGRKIKQEESSQAGRWGRDIQFHTGSSKKTSLKSLHLCPTWKGSGPMYGIQRSLQLLNDLRWAQSSKQLMWISFKLSFYPYQCRFMLMKYILHNKIIPHYPTLYLRLQT